MIQSLPHREVTPTRRIPDIERGFILTAEPGGELGAVEAHRAALSLTHDVRTHLLTAQLRKAVAAVDAVRRHVVTTVSAGHVDAAAVKVAATKR